MLAMVLVLRAQAPATLRGVVTDPSGAAVPGASVSVTGPGGLVRAIETDNTGGYAVNGLPPGSYLIRIGAAGFALFESMPVELTAARATTADARLALAADKQEITVADTTQVELDPSKNTGSTVLKGSDLDMLSDDPNDLQNDLQALAQEACRQILEAEVNRVMQICNACRYCEGFCAVFPAMTRRRAGDPSPLSNSRRQSRSYRS